MGKPRIAPLPDRGEQEQPEEVGEMFVSAAKIKAGKRSWILPGRIMAGSITMLEGDKGVGKSTFCAMLAATVTANRKFLGHKKSAIGDVLWLVAEEDASLDIAPRLRAAQADIKRVHFMKEDARGVRRRLVFPNQIQTLADAIDHFGAKLVIIDPLSSFIASEVSLRNDQDTHYALDPMIDLAHSAKCSILLTRHLSKKTSDGAINRGLGGAAVGGCARSVLSIEWPDRNSPRRVLRLIACNGAGNASPVEYEIGYDGKQAPMHSIRELSPEDDDPLSADLDEGEKDALDNAKVLLRRLIGNEWVSATAIKRESEQAMVSISTLRRGKKALGVQARRNGRAVPACWEWGPPKKGWKGGVRC